MVKLKWFEETAIYIVVFIGTFFLFELITYTPSLVVSVIFLIVFFGLSNIIINLIKGKDTLEEEEKERKEKEKKNSENIDKKINNSKNWWKRQNDWEKVIIILGFIVIVLMILGLIFPNI
jgi:flagellar biosynthesis/type III secretory pathway M-ring protein FliF/YscJ